MYCPLKASDMLKRMTLLDRKWYLWYKLCVLRFKDMRFHRLTLLVYYCALSGKFDNISSGPVSCLLNTSFLHRNVSVI